MIIFKKKLYIYIKKKDVIKSVVDEILAVLKNEDTKDSDKKLEIEGLINKISNEFFSDLLLNAKLLTDYNPEIDE
jgi:pre-mRNA-splicing helicase BRR2